ncbi:putative peptidase [Fervidicola ferrireducens]|uniref:Putative peptidase n=1 Tax=Fervidicola ferrireducens TaxID=520764 RepID=A0A140L8V4_9FIRM|nr:Xaa-Pro peptidase family protein [Fervidicola ferrireducens]KXG76979.1 putative peptidase [Fervidicola ferrireducens]
MNEERLKKILKEMERQNVPQLVISEPASIFYLTGKWIHPGERMLALYIDAGGECKLFLNELFPVSEDLGLEKIFFNDVEDPVELLSKHVKEGETLGVDKNWPARFLLRLMEFKKGCKFVVSDIVDRVRMRKDPSEINLMRESSKINSEAVKKILELIPGGHTEKKMGRMLLKIYEDLGADGFSFEPIIAYGANAADPHHVPGNSTVKEGDSIIIDIGCVKYSYCSDITRTVFYKKVSEEAKKIYNIVLEANMRAIEAVRPGVRFCDIDAAARNCIESAGYGRYFTHRTGHSIGIEVHEPGDVSAANMERIEAGMIFSIEPGIYIPGKLGVRIEDLVVVTDEGCEVLTMCDKNLTVIE